MPDHQWPYYKIHTSCFTYKQSAYYDGLEKEARVVWQPLVNLLGTHTYKFINLRTSGLRNWALALNYVSWGTTQNSIRGN